MQTHRNSVRVLLGCARNFLLATMLCASSSRAQQSQPEISYEGQPVASIHLVAAPSVKLRPLRPLVKLQTHQPYSEAKIRASASALQAAGHFERVDLQITPEANGVRVTFLLQPVYYLGMISFSDPIGRFDYSQLREVVSYPDETPYEPERVREGADRLKGFFVNEGYFQAEVQEHSQFDPAHKLADIEYDITPGKAARFGVVQVSGPPPTEQKRLLSSLHSIRARLRGARIKPGKAFHPQRVSRATQQLQRYLGNHEWLASHVAVEKPQYNPESNRVPIHFKVTLGPKVRIRVAGARVHGKALKDLVPIYEERAFDRELVAEGGRAIAAYLQSKGYFDAKVTPKIVRNPSEILLTYQVQRGRRHKVKAIRYTGNRHFDEDKLDTAVEINTAHFFSRGKYSQALVSKSVNNLKNFYHNAGFENVDVQSSVADRNSRLYVTFKIKEGQRTTVHALNVTGLKTQKLDKLAPGGLLLRAGQPFSPAGAARDRNHIVASYLNLGYPQVTFQATASPLPNNPLQVNVNYAIHEGPQVSTREVVILGERHTNTAFIMKNANIKAGSPLSQHAMLQAESTLYGIGIFDWASVGPAHPALEHGQAGKSTSTPDLPQPAGQPQADHQDQDYQSVDVLLKVHESKRNSLTYGFGFLVTPRTGQISTGIVQLPGLPAIGLPASFKPIQKSLISPEGSVTYSRLNLRGRDETASVSTVLSRLDQRLTFTYADPHFRSSIWSSLVSFSAERTTQNPLFSARLGQASLQFDRPLNSAQTERLEFRYSFERTSLTNLLIKGFVPPEDQSILASTLTASFTHDTRDDPLDAHRGVFETVDVGLTPTVLGSTDSFARFFGQASFYRQMKPWLVWANRVEAGVIGAFAGSHVPLSERFFTGGADSMRGFPINGAGPQTTGILCTNASDPSSCSDKVLLPTGGPQLFILNSEGRFPIPLNKNLGGAIFYDGGNVFNHIGFGHFFSQYSNTLGFGFRYKTPVGPIRVDIGRNLSPVPGLKATQVFVTLGQAF